MPAVPKPERRDRAARLRAMGQRSAQRFFSTQQGQLVSLLVEAGDRGHSEHFAPVRLSVACEPGRLLAARVTGATDDGLLAEAA
jgi:threonylcarbamoyladenosine tRNA methylthiotransferase MtaB